MNKFKVIKGDLIELAKQGEFDAIAHGCNCFSTQKSGIAKRMVQEFKTDEYPYENVPILPIMKLGIIDYKTHFLPDYKKNVSVINCYTQYEFGKDKRYLDYEALAVCLKKINNLFKDKEVGIPWIGCGLAGGNKEVVAHIIAAYLNDVNLTIVEYDTK